MSDELMPAQSAAGIVRRAAERIETYGWTQGAHARTTGNVVCRILDPDAAYWSIYGAVYKEMYLAGLADGDVSVQQSMIGRAIWQVLTRQAVSERTAYTGVHPVIEFNDAPGRSQAEVTGFLRDCAALLEQAAPSGGAS